MARWTLTSCNATASFFLQGISEEAEWVGGPRGVQTTNQPLQHTLPVLRGPCRGAWDLAWEGSS